jgi:hypothetical protein
MRTIYKLAIVFFFIVWLFLPAMLYEGITAVNSYQKNYGYYPMGCFIIDSIVLTVLLPLGTWVLFITNTMAMISYYTISIMTFTVAIYALRRYHRSNLARPERIRIEAD